MNLEHILTVMGDEWKSDHLLHFVLSPDYLNATISCEHDPADERWLARDDEGEGEVMEPHECYVHSWIEADGFDSCWIVGHWPDDPPSPCPVDCSWTGDGIEVTFATEEGGS